MILTLHGSISAPSPQLNPPSRLRWCQPVTQKAAEKTWRGVFPLHDKIAVALFIHAFTSCDVCLPAVCFSLSHHEKKYYTDGVSLACLSHTDTRSLWLRSPNVNPKMPSQDFLTQISYFSRHFNEPFELTLGNTKSSKRVDISTLSGGD